MLTAPITTTKVANELQTSSHDVGTLCEHANINMWSKWKPVRHSTTSGLTEEQLKDTNYGLDVGNWFYLSAIECLNAAPNCAWSYLKPRNGTDPHRLGDFRNYNKNAIRPFQTEVYARDGITGSMSPIVGITCGRISNDNTDFALEDLGLINNPSRAGWCLLYRNTANSSYEVQIAGVDPNTGTIDFPLDRVANDLSITANVDPGTYDICACIWSYQQGFICLPGSYLRKTVKNQSASEAHGYDVQLFAYAQQSTPRKIYVKASMMSGQITYTQNVSWQLTIYIYDSNGTQRDYYRYSGTQSMAWGTVDRDEYIPFNFGNYSDSTYGSYYVWNDYSGVGNQATYKVELIVYPVDQEMYRITETVTPPILPDGIEIPNA